MKDDPRTARESPKEEEKEKEEEEEEENDDFVWDQTEFDNDVTTSSAVTPHAFEILNLSCSFKSILV